MRWFLLCAALVILSTAVYVLLRVLPSFAIIDQNKELAGGLIASAGTIFAAVIAWAALTTQIEDQRTSTKIAARTYWQSQRGSAETVVSGLKLILRTANSLKSAYERRDTNATYPAVEGLKLIQKTGVLDTSQFPPSGNELFAWDLNIHITTLRIWWHRVGTGQNTQDLAEADKAVEAAVRACIDLIDEMGAALARNKKDVSRAELTLKELDVDN